MKILIIAGIALAGIIGFIIHICSEDTSWKTTDSPHDYGRHMSPADERAFEEYEAYEDAKDRAWQEQLEDA